MGIQGAGLDPDQRAQLGAHYTSEDDIKALVEPVLMAPLRREWTALRRDLAPSIIRGKGTPAERGRLTEFQRKIAGVTVLDPSCGSGNFLYVSLQLLLGLEKEVISAAAQIGWTFSPQVSVQQLRAIELNAYAYELAQVSVQIGFLQWRRDNGFDNDRSPVLQNLAGFENKDALLNETFRTKPKTLKAAQAEEHGGQDELFKAYTERAWPECSVIVGNPPFLGDKIIQAVQCVSLTRKDGRANAKFRSNGTQLDMMSKSKIYDGLENSAESAKWRQTIFCFIHARVPPLYQCVQKGIKQAVKNVGIADGAGSRLTRRNGRPLGDPPGTWLRNVSTYPATRPPIVRGNSGSPAG